MKPVLSAEVAAAIADGRPVVAMESTIYSHLGLPSPANREALDRCSAAIRDGGCVPAVTAILDGVVRLGLTESEHERILGPARKVADLSENRSEEINYQQKHFSCRKFQSRHTYTHTPISLNPINHL